MLDKKGLELSRNKVSANNFALGSDWLRKNDKGIWELRLSGTPFEIGAHYSVLAEELIQQQEAIFVKEFSKAVPGRVKQFFLKHLVGWFNRKLDRNIPSEYLEEMYGLSHAYSKEFNFIAPPYMRVLNYHAAHDIGHALTDYQLVACTSFAARGTKTSDGKLISGRNFDFYSGDEFAETKVMSFIHPENGYRFASLSWPGFIGVVSGMNEKGLTVTMNAAKSTLPTSSKTPISVLGREILQYASTTKEAIEIAAKRRVFVSEAIMVNSASENKTVLIEKAPKAAGVFAPDTEYTVCANHYQSERFANDELNLENIERSDSIYRHRKMQQLLDSKNNIDHITVAEILRDRDGENGEVLGLGNPRAINQLIAHHSVIFKPSELKMWISTAPWQIGEYICYDLNEIFALETVPDKDIHNAALTIPADPFLNTQEYKDFLYFREVKKQINEFLGKRLELELSKEEIDSFVASNPNYYETYMMIGMYLLKKKDRQAREYFEEALTKPVMSIEEEEKIKALIDKCK